MELSVSTKNKAISKLQSQSSLLTGDLAQIPATFSVQDARSKAARMYCLWLQYLITEQISVGPQIKEEWDVYGCSSLTGFSF